MGLSKNHVARILVMLRTAWQRWSDSRDFPCRPTFYRMSSWVVRLDTRSAVSPGALWGADALVKETRLVLRFLSSDKGCEFGGP